MSINPVQNKDGIVYVKRLNGCFFSGRDRYRNRNRKLNSNDPDSDTDENIFDTNENEYNIRSAYFAVKKDTILSAASRYLAVNKAISAFVRWLWPYFSKYPLFLSVVIVSLLIEAAFNAALPISFKYIIDYALIGPDMSVEIGTEKDELHLMQIIIPLSIGVILVTIIGITRRYLTQAVIAKVIRDIRMYLFDHLQRLSMSFFSKRQTGDLLSRFSGDLVSVEETLINTDAWVLLPGINVLIGTAVLFYLDWRLALLSLLVWPICLLLPNLFADAATKASYRKKQDEALTLSVLQENLDARDVVRAFGLQAWSRRVFSGRNMRLCASTSRYGFLSALIEHISLVGIVIMQVIVLGVGAFMAWQGQITIGSLTAFQAIFMSMSTNLSYVTQFMPNLIQASSSITRLDEIVGEVPDVDDVPDALPLSGFKNEIRFTNLSFGYTASAYNLEDISFVVRRGQRVAFVGGSGSGKSTILKLIMRFYDPQKGSVTVDGLDIRSVTQSSLRRLMGVVFQDNFLFNLSIRENLRLSRSSVTDAEIEAAAKDAEIHESILEMPCGYDTPVGERGGMLSGGQRQRMAIARALLNNPEILILDEATSALDPMTEEAINETLERVGRTRTVIMVSHRLDAVKGMDRIIVLDHGRIVEEGRHEELLSKNGLYAGLWRKQAGECASPKTT